MSRTLPLLLLALLLAGCVASRPSNPVGVFNLCFNDRDAAAQLELVGKLGYDGLMIGTWEDKTPWPKLHSFADIRAVRDGQVRILAILAGFELGKPVSDAELNSLAKVSARLRAPLWTYVGNGGKERTAEAVALLRRLADACTAQGGSLVLYPHEGCVFSSVEESVAILDALQRPGVTTSFHLCHELKAGNGGRLDEVIRRNIARISLVSLNGTDTARFGKPGWDGVILPLDRGDYDLTPVVRSLKSAGYAGPVLMHTYGIKTPPPEEHLAASLRRWRELSR